MKSSLPISALVASTSASLYGQSSENHTCALTPDYKSCSAIAHPDRVDSCCVETYGGLLLLTQYWRTYTGLEEQGQLLPDNTWTIHGLWPDFCNGSYPEYCDLNRQFDPEPFPEVTNDGRLVPAYNGSEDIGTFIEPFGRYDLLEYMNKHWIGRDEPSSTLWAHEFAKHATCFSTFDLPCYGPQYRQHEDVVDYFETTVMYNMRFPTWSWLTSYGISPSNSTSYTLSDIEDALTRESGATPTVGCSGPRYNETEAGKGSMDDGYTQLYEVWYYFHPLGRPQDGNVVPVLQTSESSCAKAEGAVHYFERSEGSVTAS